MDASLEPFPVVEDWLQIELTQNACSQLHHLPFHILSYLMGRYRKAKQAPNINLLNSYHGISFWYLPIDKQLSVWKLSDSTPNLKAQ